MRLWAVIPAAGSSSRLGGETPKQYQKLAGKQVLQRTIEALAKVDGLKTFIIAISRDDEYFAGLSLPENLDIITVAGGATRADSVLNCLKYLKDSGLNADDWVLVHDAARPLVKISDVENLLAKIEDSSVGGILAVKVAETVKQVKANGNIDKTLNRDKIYLAQTPQIFRFGILFKGLERAVDSKVLITDEAQAIENIGLSPILVAADKTNIKLTYKEDLDYINWVLNKDDKCE